MDAMSAQGAQKAVERPSKSAWAYPYVWLVVAGPALVVVASMFTLWLALRHPEVSVLELPAAASARAVPNRPDMAPAMQGRNHATTGGLVQPVADPVAQTPGHKTTP